MTTEIVYILIGAFSTAAATLLVEKYRSSARTELQREITKLTNELQRSNQLDASLYQKQLDAVPDVQSIIGEIEEKIHQWDIDAMSKEESHKDFMKHSEESIEIGDRIGSLILYFPTDVSTDLKVLEKHVRVLPSQVNMRNQLLFNTYQYPPDSKFHSLYEKKVLLIDGALEVIEGAIKRLRVSIPQLLHTRN